MSLSLPEDIEPFLTDGYEQLTSPAVYALTLTVPTNVRQRWQKTFDSTPDYLDMVEQKPTQCMWGPQRIWLVGWKIIETVKCEKLHCSKSATLTNSETSGGLNLLTGRF